MDKFMKTQRRRRRIVLGDIGIITLELDIRNKVKLEYVRFP